MNVKYIYLLLIPALFIVGSCTSEERKIEKFMDFSSDLSTRDEITQIDDNLDKKDKPETKAPEKTTENKTVENQETAPDKPVTLRKAEIKRTLKKFNLGYLTFDVADFFGEITPLESTEDYTRYRFRFYSRTNGFIDYLFGWMSHTVSVMRVYDNKVVPESFRTKVVLKKKTREITLDYDQSGENVTFEEVIPPDNRGKRPAVENKLKLNTYDPLSIVMEARRVMIQAFRYDNFNNRGKYSFSLPLYDGRRRSNVNFELDKKKVNGLYHLKIVQKPVAGYTNNELAEIKKGDRSIDIYINSDFWPVSAVGQSPLGYGKAKYIKDCDGEFKECVTSVEPKK